MEEGEGVGIVGGCDCAYRAPIALCGVAYAVVVGCTGLKTLNFCGVAVDIEEVFENTCDTNIKDRKSVVRPKCEGKKTKLLERSLRRKSYRSWDK